MVITMTNEDTAWEQFSKADAANIGDASAVGMLQAIMAELNSIKADTARLEQKIDGGAGEAPMDAGMPPMEEGAPAEMPPMDAGVPPMDEGAPAEMPPMEPPASEPAPMMGGDMGGMTFPGEEVDETLAALQDAISQVSDPDAIAKLADIIKDYVGENYQGPGAEAVPEAAADVPPEVLIEALAGAGDEMPPVEGDAVADDIIGTSGEDAVVTELLDAMTKSETETLERCDSKEVESIAEGGEVPSEDVGMNGQGDAPADTIAESGEDEQQEPAIQINLFLGAKMEDIIDDNAKKGLTNKDNLPTDSFKVCDTQKSFKRSIDDLINQNMRAQSGIDGKRYKITKSANELAIEEFQSIQKSIGSFNAVKDMRVGDILTTMQGLGKRGMTSIEKSYEPLIDEMVKYCDNNISPLYTAPIFKSFGLDLDKLYEPIDMAPFEKALPGLEGGATSVDWSKFAPGVTDDQKAKIVDLITKLRANRNALTGNAVFNRRRNAARRFRPVDDVLLNDYKTDPKSLANVINLDKNPDASRLAGLYSLISSTAWGPQFLEKTLTNGRVDPAALTWLLKQLQDAGTIGVTSREDMPSRMRDALRGFASDATPDALNDLIFDVSGENIGGFQNTAPGKREASSIATTDTRNIVDQALLAIAGLLNDAPGDSVAEKKLNLGTEEITLEDLLGDLGVDSIEDLRDVGDLGQRISRRYAANTSANPLANVSALKGGRKYSRMNSVLGDTTEYLKRYLPAPGTDGKYTDEDDRNLAARITALDEMAEKFKGFNGTREDIENLIPMILGNQDLKSIDDMIKGKTMVMPYKDGEKRPKFIGDDGGWLKYKDDAGNDKQPYSDFGGMFKDMFGNEFTGVPIYTNTLDDTKALNKILSAGKLTNFDTYASVKPEVIEELRKKGAADMPFGKPGAYDAQAFIDTVTPMVDTFGAYSSDRLGSAGAIGDISGKQDFIMQADSLGNPADAIYNWYKGESGATPAGKKLYDYDQELKNGADAKSPDKDKDKGKDKPKTSLKGGNVKRV